MRYDDGFTITEILLAMAISLVVMASVYTVYNSQQKSYVAQEQVVAMQQNLRAGMSMMARDIRMAGYDPTGAYNAGITLANNDAFEFTRVDESGTTVERIRYNLYDSGQDGDDELGKKINGGNNMLVAENIDAINFVYLDANQARLDDDGDGNVTTNIPNIRSIQITVVARTDRKDRGYTDNTTYRNQSPWNDVIYTPPANDNFRRRVLTREIKCRNLGLGG